MALLFLFAGLVGCASGGDSGVDAVPKFSGKPSNFNGTWTGTGAAQTDHWSETNLRYTLHISKTPDGVDLHFEILEADGSRFSMGRVVDHYVVGNTLYSFDKKKPVGTIGTDGFTLDREDTGEFIVQLEQGGRLNLKGHLQYGQTQVQISATLR